MLQLQRMLTVLLCAGIVAAFTGCASESKTRSGATGGQVEKKESTGQYIDDSAITTKVKSALAGDPDTKATQINVKTYQGVVQLSGFVDSDKAVQKAGEIAKGVAGVKSVKNSLTVK